MESNGSKSATDAGECKHEHLEPCYGFARTSGWRGIGVAWYCMDCYHVPQFDDDTECMSPDEIEHNKKKREGIAA